MKTKILVFSETVTMAHVVRPATLAGHLEPDQYHIIFAASIIPGFIKNKYPHFEYINLTTCVSQSEFMRALNQGTFPYNKAKVREQIAEDLFLIDKFKPDLILGDFRFSLAISAKLKKTPFVNISNTIWNPSSTLPQQAPDIAMVNFFGSKISNLVFRVLSPLIFWWMARPFNQVAKEMGTTPIGNLMKLFTCGDYVLYADTKNLIATKKLTKAHFFVGPIHADLPFEMPNIKGKKYEKIIVVALGSSGPQHLLKTILSAIENLPVLALVATSGSDIKIAAQENVILSPFLPLEASLKLANLAITNGGSPMGYSCLANGVPFIGVASNMDQITFTTAVERKGAGRLIRARQLSKEKIRNLIQSTLDKASFQENAKQLQNELTHEVAILIFPKVIKDILNEKKITSQIKVKKKIPQLLESQQTVNL